MMFRFTALFLALLSVSFAFAAEDKKTLPEPLSFQAALDFAKLNYHYSVIYSQSEISLTQDSYSESNAINDVEININGYIRKVGISDLSTRTKDGDSKISLIAKKNLYDFGLMDDKEKWLESQIKVSEADFSLKKELYLNQVVEAYFEVLKADNNYLTNNENMSVAFILFDRAQQKLEFGVTSEVEILKAQSNYETVRQQRYFSESQQRFTRQVLAELLGSETLPDQLETPEIKTQRKIIGDVSMIFDLALLNSHSIKLQQLKLKSAKLGISLAASSRPPSIDAEIEISDYEYSTLFRDKWRASINFNIPLYSGDRTTSAIRSATTRYKIALADMQKAQSLLRIKVLTLWQSITQKTMELEGARVEQDYRDLYLDQSRTNYELEYNSDLGDSMVQFSRSRSDRLATEFDLELAWRELVSLIGNNNRNKILKVAKSN